uniref:hypothetical protein n=1 Tax=Oceanivirga salmonicida TaxID=1769291 RepID=UPI001E5DB57E
DQADKMGLTAYNDYNEDDTFGEFKNLKVFKVINDSRTGLRGYALQDIETKEFIIAFRGTQFNDKRIFEKLKDLKSDEQLTRRNNDQYLSAYKEVMDLISENSEMQGKVILLVGHSLGGGIANYLSLRIENTQSFVSDPTPVVKDEILKREIAIRIEKERKFAKELNTDPRDVSGYTDLLGVIPNKGLANGTTKNENDEIIANSRYKLVPYFGGRYVDENNQIRTEVATYYEILAFQNSTNLKEENDKEEQKALKNGDILKYLELSRNRFKRLMEHHQNAIVDSKVDKFTNQKKKYKIKNINIKKGAKR